MIVLSSFFSRSLITNNTFFLALKVFKDQLPQANLEDIDIVDDIGAKIPGDFIEEFIRSHQRGVIVEVRKIQRTDLRHTCGNFVSYIKISIINYFFIVYNVLDNYSSLASSSLNSSPQPSPIPLRFELSDGDNSSGVKFKRKFDCEERSTPLQLTAEVISCLFICVPKTQLTFYTFCD